MNSTRLSLIVAAIVVGRRQSVLQLMGSGLLLSALFLGAVPAAAGVSCPENTMWEVCDDTLRATSTAPSWNFDFNEPWDVGVGCVTGCYDLVSGVITATGSGCAHRLQVHDEYQVVGPAGPTLSFEAVLVVYNNEVGGGSYRAGISQSRIEPGSEQCTEALFCEASIPVHSDPGETFPIWAVVEADGGPSNGFASAACEIRFRSLPAGYMIVSCQHYDAPTPTHATSWGSIKALYR